MAFAECCSHPNIPQPCVNIPLDRSRSDPCQSAYHCTHRTQFRHVGATNLQELDSKLWGPLVMSQLSFSISQVTRPTSRKKQLLSIEFGCIEFGSFSSDTRPRKQPVPDQSHHLCTSFCFLRRCEFCSRQILTKTYQSVSISTN